MIKCLLVVGNWRSCSLYAKSLILILPEVTIDSLALKNIVSHCAWVSVLLLVISVGNVVVVRSPQATSCSALGMPTSSDILQVILDYVYTDESPTIKGTQNTPDHAYTTCTHTNTQWKMLRDYGWKIALLPTWVQIHWLWNTCALSLSNKCIT